jgi:FtsH-binding integral membrane protein
MKYPMIGIREKGGPMTTSKTIAGLMGPTLVAGAAAVLLNLASWPALAEQAFRDPPLIFASGFPLFVAGLAIVRAHNRWSRGWPVLVTVFGWLAVLGGLSRILFPTRLADIAIPLVHSTAVFATVAVVLLVAGAFLSFKSYSRE